MNPHFELIQLNFIFLQDVQAENQSHSDTFQIDIKIARHFFHGYDFEKFSIFGTNQP